MVNRVWAGAAIRIERSSPALTRKALGGFLSRVGYALPSGRPQIYQIPLIWLLLIWLRAAGPTSLP